MFRFAVLPPSAMSTSKRGCGCQPPLPATPEVMKAVKDDSIKLDSVNLPLPSKAVRKPRRRWMSVTDLVTEVEQALVKGERLNKESEAYINLKHEAKRLRLDNDDIMAQVDNLKKVRRGWVKQEDEITAKLHAAGGFALHEATMTDVLQRLREVDLQLAAFRNQQQQNIRDVGHLKRAMSRIEKHGEVTSLVDRIDDTLHMGKAVDKDNPVFAEISELFNGLRTEFDKVPPKVMSYEQDICSLTTMAQTTALDMQGKSFREADDARMTLVSHLQQAKRMLAQLARLSDIQILNAQEVGMLARAQSQIQKHAQIRDLIKSANNDQITAKIRWLQDDTSSLRSTIRDIEAGMDSRSQESLAIIDKLRSLKDVLTAETGKLREQLIASIHEEEQGKARLAALRGEKLQNIRFIAMLRSALPDDGV